MTYDTGVETYLRDKHQWYFNDSLFDDSLFCCWIVNESGNECDGQPAIRVYQHRRPFGAWAGDALCGDHLIQSEIRYSDG